MSKFNCERTPEMICPHCGTEQSDAWEYQLNDGNETEVDCDKCAKKFRVFAEIKVKYTSCCLECSFEFIGRVVTLDDGKKFKMLECAVCGQSKAKPVCEGE